MDISAKPRLLYFNGPWDYVGARIRQSYIEPFAALLAQDFDVVSVQGNCDFGREVELHRPDLVLFHTGCEAPGEPEVTITNTDRFPEIPRLGYMFRDPFSPSRAVTMNRMNAWRVNQVFTDFRPTDAPAAYFKETMFLPWWVDDTLFRDYGEEKSLCVTLTGSGWFTRCIYTWRREVCMQLLPRVPVFIAPSLGNRQNGHDYTGEAYARLLNRSQFSGGCGTVSRYLTLKLLEIPASRCCLIAEEMEVLKAMGFRDGVNCIFADSTNVAAKVQALLNDPGRLQAITDAGFRLVHDQHTQRNRRVFAEWFRCWQSKQPGERIVQTNPFGPLQVIAANAPHPGYSFPEENPLTETLLDGYRLLAAESWTEALAKFDWIIELVPCVAEARLGAALCHLRLGRPADALPHTSYSLNLMVKHFGFTNPDPIDLAMHTVVLLRNKDAAAAAKTAAAFPELRHPALNALRWILARSNPALTKLPAYQVREGDEHANFATVHILPPASFSDWVRFWMTSLRAPAPFVGQKMPHSAATAAVAA